MIEGWNCHALTFVACFPPRIAASLSQCATFFLLFVGSFTSGVVWEDNLKLPGDVMLLDGECY